MRASEDASAVANPRNVQRIRAAAAAEAAFLPVHARFGVRAVSAEVGRVEVAQRMGQYCLDRHGRLSPGSFLVGSDTVLGSSIASRLPRRPFGRLPDDSPAIPSDGRRRGPRILSARRGCAHH